MHACSYMYMPYSFNKEHHSLHYINCWIACSVHSDVALSEAHNLTGLASDGIMQWTLSPKWYKYDNAVKKIKWANLSMPPDANKTLSTCICTVYMHLIVLIIIIIHSSVMYIMTLYIMYLCACIPLEHHTSDIAPVLKAPYWMCIHTCGTVEDHCFGCCYFIAYGRHI